MDSVGLNTYADFNLCGKDMRYDKLQKRLQKNQYAKNEKEIYLKKLGLLKNNISELHKQAILAFSLAGAALLCQILFRGVNKIHFADIEKIKNLARQMTEHYNLNKKGFRAVLAEKNKSSYIDIYGSPVPKLKHKLTRCAFYLSPSNIAVAWKDSPLELFHEIGHGVTGCKKHGAKWLHLACKMPLYSPVPALLCIADTSDADKKPHGLKKLYKTLDVLKDNAYLVSMAMFAPLLLEEFNASKRAFAFLSKNDKTLALKSLLLFVPAFCSYLVNAVAVSNLVKFLNTKADNIYLQKSLYRQSKHYENTLNFDESITPKIAVIDEYHRKSVKIDWDNKPDMIHGVAVESFIKKGLPNAQISRFDTNLDEVSVKNALDDIIKSRVKYDAINISKSSDIKISDLSKLMGVDLNTQNLKMNKKLIKEKFFASSYSDVKDIRDIINKLEFLASRGVKIYVSAGNKGKEYLNLYTLADNINVVGAANKYGVSKANFSCDNSLVIRWCKGVFKVKKIKTSDAKMAFDINEDGKADILTAETSSKFKIPQRYIYGTSFAAPGALVNDLKRELDE